MEKLIKNVNGVQIILTNPEALPRAKEVWTNLMTEIIIKTEPRKKQS